MNITAFSFLSAIICFNIYIIFLALIRRYNRFIFQFGLMPLAFMIILSLFRLLFSVEFPFTIGVDSTEVLPRTVALLTTPCAGKLQPIHLLIGIWIVGTGCLIINYMKQVFFVSRLLKDMPPTTHPQLLTCMDKIVHGDKKPVKIKIVQFPDCIPPMIIGFFKPIICLPDMPFADKDLQNILRHEWSHYTHNDSWIKLVVYLISAVFWWNPFVHLFRKDLNHILELQCDLRVTHKMNNSERTDYLESLMKIIRLTQSHRKDNLKKYATVTCMLISTGHHKKITQRFYMVLQQTPKYAKHKFFAYLLCLLMIISCALSYSFVIQPSYSAPEDADTYIITPQNAYLKQNENGTYDLYVDNSYKSPIVNLNEEPFSSLLIIR